MNSYYKTVKANRKYHERVVNAIEIVFIHLYNTYMFNVYMYGWCYDGGMTFFRSFIFDAAWCVFVVFNLCAVCVCEYSSLCTL